MSAATQGREILASHRAGDARGLPSWCTAHPRTLTAVLAAYRECPGPILVEATCNQVNPHGGYTGLTPAGFRSMLEGLAREAGVDPARLWLGGDHLGPNPWRHLPAAAAMDEARAMVKAYVEAGFSKIHLDASMACADDTNLSEAEMAARAADLCAVAERARGGRELVYVIGTEVPIPGGETEAIDALAVTRPESIRRTFELHHEAFEKSGCARAFGDVVGIVAQPGVDFGNRQVFDFDRAKAAGLSQAVLEFPGVVFEAHSTDYQTERALADLVASHFAILKVGPWLTFAFREAVVALSQIAAALSSAARADVIGALEAAMDSAPNNWRPYVERGPGERVDRLYGFSDRVRYYWADAGVEATLRRLIEAVESMEVPPGLLSQFLGDARLGAGTGLAARAFARRVGEIVNIYRRACGD